MKIKIGDLEIRMRALMAIDPRPDDDLTYAIKRTNSRIDKALERARDAYREKEEDAERANAKKSADGIVLLDDKGRLQYSVEGHAQLSKQKKINLAWYQSQEVEFEPYHCQPCPRLALVDRFTKEELEGILFSPPAEILN